MRASDGSSALASGERSFLFLQGPQSYFFERVGRRFVYATLALAFVALLALVVPSTGPVRGPSAADLPAYSQEASLVYSDPIGESSLQEAPDLAPVESPVPAVPNEVK